MEMSEKCFSLVPSSSCSWRLMRRTDVLMHTGDGKEGEDDSILKRRSPAGVMT